MASGVSLELGYGVKGLALIHILIGTTLLAITLLVNPSILMCSGQPYASFQLFLLSWWLWRFPRINDFRAKMIPISLIRQPMTTEQEEHHLQLAWRLQLFFVILWGWICTFLFWELATWWILLAGCPSLSILLLVGIFTAIIGWILGSAWVVQRVYRG